jgi:hypothetical protein
MDDDSQAEPVTNLRDPIDHLHLFISSSRKCWPGTIGTTPSPSPSCASVGRRWARAMGEDGKLLVIEGVVPPGNEPSVSKFFDLAMMALPGGMERTQEEYRQLFEAAGFRLARIVPTRTWVSVIEGEGSA